VNKRSPARPAPDVQQPDLKPHQLEIFCAVARHLSYVRAADSLYLSQPAVSQQVKALEATLGVRLFVRSGRGIVLTPAGEDLLPRAERLLGLLGGTSAVVDAIHGLRRGSVVVGASTSAGAYVVPRLLGDFHAAFPGIRLTLNVGNRVAVEQLLLARRVDLAVMGGLAHPEHFVVEYLMPNELIMVAAPGHRLTGRSRVPLSDLAAETLLLREPGSGTRLDTERVFARAGVPMRASMELSDIGAIKEAAAAGLGVAALFRQAAEREVADGDLVELDVEGFPLQRRWYVAHVRGRRLARAAAALREHLLRRVAR
jgi:LysR family transcriptional regulator, low CO2-responsive transcriptional regulator